MSSDDDVKAPLEEKADKFKELLGDSYGQVVRNRHKLVALENEMVDKFGKSKTGERLTRVYEEFYKNIESDPIHGILSVVEESEGSDGKLPKTHRYLAAIVVFLLLLIGGVTLYLCMYR